MGVTQGVGDLGRDPHRLLERKRTVSADTIAQ
jgi:hypothetical protein